ncbi:MAG: restriction endonuclease subunit S [Thaumarchaeota archaeon]|nr:restriction endonuclease subunit S [Nitrososphaerota archaeon]
MLEDWCPNGWKRVTLRDLGHVGRGKSKHRPRDDSILYGGKYPFIQTGDVKKSEGRIVTYNQTYNEMGLAQSKLWPKDTMCITIAANIAETGILTFPACFPDSIIGFIPDLAKCNVFFIEYVFRFLKRYIQHESVGTGTVQDNINLQTIHRLEFPIPPLNIQNRLTSILKSFDDQIEFLRQMNIALEKTIQFIFKSWFVDFDGQTEFVDSELGKIPKGWKVKPVGEVSKINEQNIDKNYSYSYIEYIDIASVSKGVLLETKILPLENSPSRAKRIVKDYDILWSTVRPNRKSYLMINESTPQLIASTGFAIITSKFVPASFLYSHLTTEEFVNYLSYHSDGTAYPAVNPDWIGAYLIVVPPAPIIENYDRIAKKIFDLIWDNRLIIPKLSEIRDSLLPKLMSGEIRV